MPPDRTRSSRAGSSATDGWGARGDGMSCGPSSRSTPSILRSCTIASLPVSEIASKAASARSGAVRTATGPASACTTIRLTAWERMSCISRAILARSRAAARSASIRRVSSS